MPTLNEITDGHSKRITRITQIRDSRLRDATDTRDRQLRVLPAAATLYDAFDAQIAEARGRQLATDAKAESGRAGAHHEGGDALAGALAEAHRVRREADAAAFEKRRKAEADAEREFVLALAAAPSKPSTEAQKVRAEKLEKAKKEFDAALTAAQEQFRIARDAALVADSRASRDADRAFATATRVSESATKVARATAEQTLAKALAALPEAASAFAEWRQATSVILADYKRAENEEFARFHEEVEALNG